MSKNFTIKPLEPDMLTDMYLTFLDSFSDYQIPFKLNKKQFVDKFVAKLKIDFDYSVGAWNTSQGMEAFVFTTIAQYQNKLIAYNGGTGVRPKARKNGLVVKMYDYLLPRLKLRSVEQCVLEVLVQNQKAIRAYQKVGFKKTGFLRCYKLYNPFPFSRHAGVKYKLTSTSQPILYQSFIDESASFLDTLLLNGDCGQEKIIEAYDQNKCVGFLIYQPSLSRVNLLGVSQIYRRMGIASGLLSTLIEIEKLKQVTVLNVPEEGTALNAFFTNMGFKNELNQYEMRLDLV
ncbi:MAG: GNAT family N-acetyltransferase [Bacteroidota bacterium]